jgi:hypothetical protein
LELKTILKSIAKINDMTNFKEEDHPRDKEGKFTNRDEDDLIIVSGNKLGSYSNIEELREKAVEY